MTPNPDDTAVLMMPQAGAPKAAADHRDDGLAAADRGEGLAAADRDDGLAAADRDGGLAAADRDDGLAAELAKAAPRRWWNRGTVVLGAAALLVGGFVGGMQVQKSYGTETPTASARPGGGAGGARGAGGYGNFGSSAGGSSMGGGSSSGGGSLPGGSSAGGSSSGGGAAPATAATTGKVKLVNGTTIYVETADGTVITVRTGTDTAVQTATAGKLKDVKAGDTVSVQGATDAEGTVTATTVTKSKG